MIRAFLLVVLVGTLSSCTQEEAYDPATSAKLDKLLERNEVFEARRFFDSHQEKLPQKQRLMYACMLDNAFNAAATSNQSITQLFGQFPDQIDDTTAYDLLKLKQQNHVKLFEYQDAFEATQDLVEHYSMFMDSSESADLKNELNIWQALRDQPKQAVHQKQHSAITLINGSRVPTFINNSEDTVNLTFDTGANLSVIIASLADSMGLKRLQPSFAVKGIMGNAVTADVAIAEAVEFGNVTMKNVAFMVFPDSALYFPQANFQIYGILGYPVISALGEIQLTRDNRLIIPQEHTESAYANLAMDYLTPVIELGSKQDTFLFTFDTGANSTWIYAEYFNANKQAIIDKYELTQLRLGGAGEAMTHAIYRIAFPIKIGDQQTTLKSAVLFPEKKPVLHGHYTGNLGLDAIKSFDTMILNFDKMFVQFSMN